MPSDVSKPESARAFSKSSDASSPGAWLRLLDKLGIAVSSLCALHCVLTPLLLVVLPLFTVVELVIPHELEGYIRAAAVCFAVVGVGLGAIVHRRLNAIPLLVLGIALISVLWVTHLHGISEILVSVLASAAFVCAHLVNSASRKAMTAALKGRAVKCRD